MDFSGQSLQATQVAFAALVHELEQFSARAGLPPGNSFKHLEDRIPREFAQFLANSRTEFFNQIVRRAGEIAQGMDLDGAAAMSGTSNGLRLRSLFEQIRLPDADNKRRAPAQSQFVYDLKPFSPGALFPVSQSTLQSDEQSTEEYHRLWQGFLSDLKAIPTSHQNNPALWLDHFESLWLTYTWGIPLSEQKSDVSLYDYSKVAAAAAAALWRWHQEFGRKDAQALEALTNGTDQDEEKLLIIQGDFYGIQDFIFAPGSQTNKKSAKLLRGRSFYVSLVTELAALRLVEELGLPSTNIVLNAAGKFLILAQNTDQAKTAIEGVRRDVEAWFEKNTFAITGLGIVYQTAKCSDFSNNGERYHNLVGRLFKQMDILKLHRSRLYARKSSVLEVDYPQGPSPYDERLPNGAPIIDDFLSIGDKLTKEYRFMIFKDSKGLPEDLEHCKLPIFGFTVAIAEARNASGLSIDQLSRCWDFSLPENLSDTLFHGYARRNINGFVPRFKSREEMYLPKYDGADTEGIGSELIKSFGHLAREERTDEMVGKVALATVKGDVDNLGRIFQDGLVDPELGKYSSFAKTAAVSRQLNFFFAVYLPDLCRKHSMYTVFAGGDDFFLIGSWHKAQEMSRDLEEAFVKYVRNPEIHFSVGIAVTKPECPPLTLSRMAEDNLHKSKSSGKNRVTLFDCTVDWTRFRELDALEVKLEQYRKDCKLSSAYLYSLFAIVEMASGDVRRPETNCWRPRLHYRTIRLAKDKNRDRSDRRGEDDQTVAAKLINELLPFLTGSIDPQHGYGRAFRIPLTNLFYKLRTN